MRIFILTFLIAFAVVSDAAAQQAGAFARMGFGARGMAMSNALVADGSGNTSPYYNPALAPFMSHQHLEAGYAFMSWDRELQFLQLAAPLQPRAGIAAGLIHAGVSGIDGRDASGYHTQEYTTSEIAGFLAFGLRMGSRVTGGLSFQLYRSNLLEEIDPPLTMGLGLGITVSASESLRLGLSLSDMLAHYEWDTGAVFGSQGRNTTDRFPLRLRLGGAYAVWEGQGVVVAEYESRVAFGESQRSRAVSTAAGPRYVTETNRLRLYEGHFRLGGELWLAQPFALRAGVGQLGDFLRGAAPSAGFAVRQELGQLSMQADYAFVLESYAAGTMHLVSLKVNL